MAFYRFCFQQKSMLPWKSNHLLAAPVLIKSPFLRNIATIFKIGPQIKELKF